MQEHEGFQCHFIFYPLDQDGEVLRWYKNETRSGFNAMDGQLYTKYVLFACACVCASICGCFTAHPIVATISRKGELHKDCRRHIYTPVLSASLYRYLAEVHDPSVQLTTNWPLGTDGRWIVIQSPNRVYYIVAESEEEKM